MQDKHGAENPDARVTARMAGETAAPDSRNVSGVNGHVTSRMEDGRVTGRMEPLSPTLSASFQPPQPGFLIDNRYRVEAILTAKSSGEADIFRCVEQPSGEVLVLKVYHYRVEPKKDVLDRLVGLNHPDIVNVRGYGWWEGRFYEVMEFCAGGGMDHFMPYTEEELTPWLQEMINGLHFCHNQGIIHRDIKPSNLFFRRPGKEDLVIGDFGISSALDLDQKVRKTQSFANLTVDYTAPELFSREKNVSSYTDYYALGITLVHLFTGRSPFQDMDVNSIISAHLTESVNPPDGMSDRFKQLIRGLTEKNADNRWGYSQVQQWLNHESVLNNDGAAWTAEAWSGKSIPYPGCPVAKSPRQLADHFDEFNVEKDLFRGRISQWAWQFDPKLSDRIIEIEENYTGNKEMGVFKLRYLLNPGAPFMVGGAPVYRASELIPFLKSPEPEIQAELSHLFKNRQLQTWLAASPDISDKGRLEKRLEEMSAQLRKENRENLAPFALLYILDPGQPLYLSDDHMIARPEELSGILEMEPGLMASAVDLLVSGKFLVWLTCAFPERLKDHEFVRQSFGFAAPEVSVFALCCFFDPQTPFPFGETKVHKPEDLVALIDSDPKNRELGAAMIQNGMLRIWLTATGRLADPGPFDLVADNPDLSKEAKLEEMLHLLDASLPYPVLSIRQEEFHLGDITPTEPELMILNIENTGRGYLHGSLKLGGAVKYFSMDAVKLEGNSRTIRLEADPRGVPTGTYVSAALHVASNGGDARIPISFSVGLNMPLILKRCLRTGALFAGLLGFLRWVIADLYPQIPVFDFNRIKNPASDIGMEVPLAAAALLVFFIIVFFWCRSKKVESNPVLDSGEISVNSEVWDRRNSRAGGGKRPRGKGGRL